MKQLLFIILFSIFLKVDGQEINGGPVNIPSDGVIDGVYIQEHTPTKRLVPYEFVRESDVMFSKRVWRTIDLREKINHTLYYPHDLYLDEGKIWVKNTTRWSLWTVLKHHIMKGDLIMYDNNNPNDVLGNFMEADGDLFKYPIYPAPGKNFETDSLFKTAVMDRISSKKRKFNLDGSPMMKTDDITGEVLKRIGANGVEEEIEADPTLVWINSNDIIEYRLKEDWFFDKERSQLDVRILGIAPIVYDGEKDLDGEFKLIKGKKVLFWLYFPHCRFVLVNYNIYNPKNDAQWMSFDDLFMKRQFSSTIYKQSNTFDRTIDTYKSGVEALYESQRITEELRNFEHDLWQF
jgi:gliding motility associated protien GldN